MVTDDTAKAIPVLPPGSVRTVSCPSCGGSISLRAAGISITAICQSCGALLDVANENLEIIRKVAQKTLKTLIPIGRRGTLFGTLWEVIGYMEKTDSSGHYPWREYLLFNPYQGFRFLVEADGHWNFVKMLRRSIPGKGRAESVDLDHLAYRLFNRGEALVSYVLGEFYWRVKIGDKAKVSDYVAPPYMLSMEESDGDIVWSQGRYVDRQMIRNAFIPGEAMPFPRGVAPNQPSPYGAQTKNLFTTLLFFLACLAILQYVFASLADNTQLYERRVVADPIYRNQAVIADPIDIPGATGNLAIRGYSNVYNDWAELEVSLVNTKTVESENVIQSIEYYYGHDSDGNWSEGGPETVSVLSAVPGGQYRLLVEPDGGAFRRGQPVDFTVRVNRNAPVWSNFWIAFLMLTAYPLYIWSRSWSFETKRWADSGDFAPAMYKRSTHS